MIADIQAQLTGLTTTVRCLISAAKGSDREGIATVLKGAHDGLETLMVASPVPDQISEKALALVASMLEVAEKGLKPKWQ